jgi:F-type H+-transporting ATPase subunit b
MNINLTLIGQSITFFLFVWFCFKFIWPPLVNALAERSKKIADGLAAAERGQQEQELAEKRAAEHIKEAKTQATDIISMAQKRAKEIEEEARAEAERIKTGAAAEIEQEVNRAREHLRKEVIVLAIAGAEKVLQQEVNAAAHNSALQDLAAQL